LTQIENNKNKIEASDETRVKVMKEVDEINCVKTT